jgi:hypothetical protein
MSRGRNFLQQPATAVADFFVPEGLTDHVKIFLAIKQNYAGASRYHDRTVGSRRRNGTAHRFSTPENNACIDKDAIRCSPLNFTS